ncbi:nonstructural protein [Lisianthus necrotic ringspot virus]|uniref:Nonstructural protein n=1 Tax=Lisianthus necrotic ringspot virus TaxID=1398661 RepID=A0AAD0P9A5_9VIRU|nr:nonstructural protein [Lisianthus necrotic ringspot virus]
MSSYITKLLGQTPEDPMDPVMLNPNNGKLEVSNITEKAIRQGAKDGADASKGKIVAAVGESEFGTFGNIAISGDATPDLVSRFIIEKSTHLSNWKNDTLVGNGNDNVSLVIDIIPTWNSKKQYMMLPRVIVWVCPTAPETMGNLKMALVDQNKMSSDKKVIMEVKGTMVDPGCFVFYTNWSIHKSSNVKGKCMQMHLLCDEKYKKGSVFGAVMFSWVKEFCDSPRADSKNECLYVPINRAVAVRSSALIEACKLMIPKGSSGKVIKSQMVEIQKHLEQAAAEEEEASSTNQPSLLSLNDNNPLG